MNFLHSLWNQVLDTLLPPRCVACNVLTRETASLCSNCWQNITFISKPVCARCGKPFPYSMGENAECMGCILTPPLYSKARAAFAYNDASRRLVTHYKHYDKTHGTPLFTKLLHHAVADLLPDVEVLVPVPLHFLRLLKRRYNQSALLANALANQTEKPALLHTLRRSRRTAQQAGLSRKARLENVTGAFHVPKNKYRDIEGKTILLIDDVFTTGATITACTQALLTAGAKHVYVLTLARTFQDEV